MTDGSLVEATKCDDDNDPLPKKQTSGSALMRRFKSCSGVGVFLGLAGAFAFSVGSLLLKLLNANAKMHPFLLSAYRQSFLLFLAAPQVAYCKAPYIGKRPDWLILLSRSFFGGIGTTLGTFALAYLPLPDAGVILATTPAFTIIFARIILKEKLYFSDIPVFLVTFFGIVFILRPPFIFAPLGISTDSDGTSLQDRLIGGAFGIGAALGQCGMYLSVRKLRHVNFATISFVYALTSGPVLFVVVFATENFAMPPCYLERSMMLAVSVTAVLGQSSQAVASKFTSAGIVSLTRSAEVVFRFFWQILFLGTAISPYSILGCILVTTAMTFLSLRSFVTEKYKATPPPNKFVEKLLLIFR